MKKVFYWVSVILPLIDGITGIVDGIKKAKNDAVKEVRADVSAVASKLAQEKLLKAQRELWEHVNKAVFDVHESTKEVTTTRDINTFKANE